MKSAAIALFCAVALTSFCFGFPAQGVGSAPSENPLYPDNADGLRQLLTNMLEAAKSGESAQLTELVRQSEIPHFEDWFTTTFGQEKGESWAGPYGERLEENESRFQEQIVRLAHDTGQISVRKIDPAKMFDTLSGPLDLFLADWNPSAVAKNQPPVEHIGYFFFIDGRFRWDSTISFFTLQTIPSIQAARPDAIAPSENSASSRAIAVTPGVGGIGFPSCLYCPPAELPKGQRHLKQDVTVLMKCVIQADGQPVNIEIAKSGGADFDEKALEAVRRWRFKPAVGPGGTPVAVTMPIEISFHSLN